ncbi:SH3 domain-containing protein [Acidipropionibacterium jensenii]|uniref:SH3 domain-containing protein n=2 Tax=Acidipropionibacterium jensenii TaxID=1749 RepID=UPI001585D974|nr:SH3 domain-containing protein [Acidipropionibacterium jensenii]
MPASPAPAAMPSPWMPTTPLPSASAKATLVYATTDVRVRASATTASAIVGVLPRGGHVGTRGASVNGWTPVNYRGTNAWISTTYLTRTPSTPTTKPNPGSATTHTLVYATTDVRVRASATTASAIVGVLPRGGHVGTRGASVNGWTPVNYQGTNAWISTTYLTRTPSTPTTKPNPGSATTHTLVYATTDVRVRASATTASAIVGVLPRGGHVGTRGASVNGWTPVNYQGTNAWISTTYLTRTPSTPTTKPSTPTTNAGSSTGLVYATSWVRVRAGASTSSAILGTLQAGNHVGTRGASVNGWTPVNYQGTNAWISSDYLSRTKPATSTGSNGSSGSSTPTSSWAALTANGSSGLSGLRPSAKGIVNRTITAFPQIRTIYGIRADSMADHPSGHAVDLMLPRGSRDAALGQQIAAYFRAHAQELGVQYIMYNKQIWNISRDSEGWRAVADRGSETANHMDHVHITTIWD